MSNIQHTTARASYAELARVFLRLSILGFGGPVAHIAMAQEEIVERRKWLTREHFLDLVAATNLIPGPNSTEVMIHVGYVMKGIPGAIFTGLCFIVPSVLITLALAILYVSSGALPQIESLLWGLKPVIVAIIAIAGYRLIPSALKNRLLRILFIASIGAIILFDLPEALVMIGAGLIYALIRVRLTINTAGSILSGAILGIGDRVGMLPSLVAQTVAATAASPTLWDLFWYFLRIGSVLFGSGYVLIAYIQQDLVNTFDWLTSQQLLDAIAIGQFTPGPVSTTTAVIGYILAGVPGALVSTLGVFLPAFVLVILSAPLIPRMRRIPLMSAFLDGVNAGVLAAILVTVVDLARVSLTPLAAGLETGAAFSVIAVLLFALALIAHLRYKINATWLLILGGIIGVIVGAF